MTDFKNILGKKIEETREEEENQKKLKAKHGIDDENVKVVETNNMSKFLINKAIALLKMISAIILIIFAFVGILSIIYEAPRNEIFIIVTNTFEQIKESVKHIF